MPNPTVAVPHLLWLLAAILAVLPASELIAVRAPNDGLQPQAAIAGDGTVHLIYFAGPDNAGNVFYVRRAAGETAFSAPIRVNGIPGSAVALGSIRGARLALGRNGWIHVAWNGSAAASPKGPGNAVPMLYARKSATATAFEAQRCPMTWAVGLDGGGSVAADTTGRVYVTWHGGKANVAEPGRQVVIAASRNDGETFAEEAPAIAEPTGACGCCAMQAGTNGQGGLALLYRSANGMQRDMLLAWAERKGDAFRLATVSPWKVSSCPMSTSAIAPAKNGLLIAWEDAAGVSWARVVGGKVSDPITVAGKGAKHPALAEAADGSIAVVWTEGTGWAKGGSLQWQLYDPQGKPVGALGRKSGVPPWSIPTVIAEPSGKFSAWF